MRLVPLVALLLLVGCPSPSTTDPDGAPETTITAGADGLHTSRDVTFEFTSSVPGATFECRLDQAPPASCVSPLQLVNLPDGPHRFEVTARVGELRDATPAVREFTIDGSAPHTTVTAAPAGVIASASVELTFESNDPAASFECSLDGGPFEACVSPHAIDGLSEGSHTVELRARDEAGRLDGTPAQVTFRVDLTAPQTTIDLAPPSLTDENFAELAFSADEPGAFECALDDGAFTACSSPRQLTDLSDGTHTFAVRAIDEAGNVDATPATHVWTVNQAGPSTEITGGPTGPHGATTASFTFTSDVPGATFECQLDGGAFSACSSPSAYTSLSETSHTFAVRAVDGGFRDPTPATRSFTVDVTAPTATITSGPSGPHGSDSATFSFSSESGATFECRIDAGVPVACTSPRAFGALGEGPHTFGVAATDLAGNRGTERTRSFTVDLTDPETIIDSGRSGSGPETSATFEFRSNEAGASFQCSLDAQAFASCESPKSYVSLSAGDHQFLVRAVDLAGRTDQTAATNSFTVTDSGGGTPTRVRVIAANVTSGTNQAYEGPGERILDALEGDVIAIQEFNVGDNSNATVRAFVDRVFGSGFHYFRESGAQIPNGVISRWPILASGKWEDTESPNREYVWARIDVPGSKDLWVISVHLLTRDATTRNTEAAQLRGYIEANVPAGDYLTIAGDFNTNSRGEAALSTFSGVVETASPSDANPSVAGWPADANGTQGTNASREKPYDWVLADPDLDPYEIPVVIGSSTFPDGLVFDSRVYSPLSEVSPVQSGDSGVSGMQHMAVVRDFEIPN